MQAQPPIIPGVDMAKRYKAAVRLPDGSDVRVYSTREHPSSSHGLQVWCDRNGNAYGQINLRNPLYIVHAVEEIDEAEAAIFDSYISRREGASRGGKSTSEAKRAASRANGRKGGRPRKQRGGRPAVSDPYDQLAESERRAGEADARRSARRAAWIRRAKADGRWGEVERLRDLVRRLAGAYQATGACHTELLREALDAVRAMPPPPWD